MVPGMIAYPHGARWGLDVNMMASWCFLKMVVLKGNSRTGELNVTSSCLVVCEDESPWL